MITGNIQGGRLGVGAAPSCSVVSVLRHMAQQRQCSIVSRVANSAVGGTLQGGHTRSPCWQARERGRAGWRPRTVQDAEAKVQQQARKVAAEARRVWAGDADLALRVVVRAMDGPAKVAAHATVSKQKEQGDRHANS